MLLRLVMGPGFEGGVWRGGSSLASSSVCLFMISSRSLLIMACRSRACCSSGVSLGSSSSSSAASAWTSCATTTCSTGGFSLGDALGAESAPLCRRGDPLEPLDAFRSIEFGLLLLDRRSKTDPPSDRPPRDPIDLGVSDDTPGDGVERKLPPGEDPGDEKCRTVATAFLMLLRPAPLPPRERSPPCSDGVSGSGEARACRGEPFRGDPNGDAIRSVAPTLLPGRRAFARRELPDATLSMSGF
mmetsp:Transcript_10039/g.19644  ORF Transcript_10039/g.19644 Transcript_10039/m.19644 type:complete len:243 (+) Transcript_10039:250-978(+)